MAVLKSLNCLVNGESKFPLDTAWKFKRVLKSLKCLMKANFSWMPHEYVWEDGEACLPSNRCPCRCPMGLDTHMCSREAARGGCWRGSGCWCVAASWRPPQWRWVRWASRSSPPWSAWCNAREHSDQRQPSTAEWHRSTSQSNTARTGRTSCTLCTNQTTSTSKTSIQYFTLDQMAATVPTCGLGLVVIGNALYKITSK